MKPEIKVLLENEFQEVIKHEDNYYIINKKDIVCVLPYTLDEGGLLDKVGLIEVWNEEERESTLTLLKGFLSEDDGTNLVGANRIFYEISGVNLVDASKWMYLGNLFTSLYSDSPLRVYSVDVTGLEMAEQVMDEQTKKIFKMKDSSMVAQSDDILFLGAFTRLFNFFYAKSLK
jgi:hypothetical protein